MATYRNTKTGAIITAESKLSGGDWVLEEKQEKTLKLLHLMKVEVMNNGTIRHN